MASDSITILREGSLLPPIDEITAKGLEIWGDSPPLYHDLKCSTYTFNDLQEWSGRFRKYKAEAIDYAIKCKKLEQDVFKLHTQLAEKHHNIDLYDKRRSKAQIDAANYEDSIRACTRELSIAESECTQLRKGCDHMKKQQSQLDNDINQIILRIRNIQQQINSNREKHELVSGEREKLQFERRWYFRQRLLLQKTTSEEYKNLYTLKDNINKLRFCLHKSWRDAKESDILGHLRARQNYDYSPEWYAARTKAANFTSNEAYSSA